MQANFKSFMEMIYVNHHEGNVTSIDGTVPPPMAFYYESVLVDKLFDAEGNAIDEELVYALIGKMACDRPQEGAYMPSPYAILEMAGMFKTTDRPQSPTTN